MFKIDKNNAYANKWQWHGTFQWQLAGVRMFKNLWMNSVWFTLSDKQWWILGYEVSWVYIEGLGGDAGSRDSPLTILSDPTFGMLHNSSSMVLSPPQSLKRITSFTDSEGAIRFIWITADRCLSAETSEPSLEPELHLWEIKRILCVALLILIVDT